MARQSVERKKYDRSAREILRAEAVRLSTRFGLDATRVLSVLETTAYASPGLSIVTGVELSRLLQLGTAFRPSLEGALMFLPPQSALALFENVDLNQLNIRMVVTDFFNDEYVELYSLDELAEVTKAFLNFMARNKTALIRTGHPNYRFIESPWMRWMLEPLYYTTEPFDKRTPIRRSSKGLLIPEKDQKRLEIDRPKFFEVKMSILRELLQGVEKRDVSGLWQNCLGILTDKLTASDIDFYLYIDGLLVDERPWTEFYVHTFGTPAHPKVKVRINPFVGKYFPKNHGPRPVVDCGGITQILEIIGHYEKELTIGTFCRVRDTLENLVRAKRKNKTNLTIESYFQAVADGEREKLDSAIDLFLSLEPKEEPFWSEFDQRVNRALLEEFREDIVLSQSVKRKHMARFVPTVVTFSQWAKAHLEAAETLPQLVLSQPESPSLISPNFFRKEGEYYRISYNGTVISLKTSKGLDFIVHLLRNPNREFIVLDLITDVEGHSAYISSDYNKLSRDQLEESGINRKASLSLEPAQDDKSLANYKKRLGELKDRIEEATDFGDHEQIAKLEEERDTILKTLMVSNLKGGNRFKLTYAEKARINVTRAIKTARDNIYRANTSLGIYLRQYIHTGYYCSYKPPPDNPVILDF